jgi:hypothetical protein
MAEFTRGTGYVTGHVGEYGIGSKHQGPHSPGCYRRWLYEEDEGLFGMIHGRGRLNARSGWGQLCEGGRFCAPYGTDAL